MNLDLPRCYHVCVVGVVSHLSSQQPGTRRAALRRVGEVVDELDSLLKDVATQHRLKVGRPHPAVLIIRHDQDYVGLLGIAGNGQGRICQ